FELELTINHGRTTPYVAGDGYGHLAVVVDDLAAEHARLTKEGLQPKPIKEFLRDGSLMARFFFLEDPDGYKIEVMQKHGRYRVAEQNRLEPGAHSGGKQNGPRSKRCA